jgi:signal transduction histidine kinase
VDVRNAGSHVEVRFRDDGRGFEGDPSKLGRLFQRGSSSRGTGVGLYLVRVLMERMGGKVEFAAAPEGGFAATLRFQRSAD